MFDVNGTLVKEVEDWIDEMEEQVFECHRYNETPFLTSRD
jgi:hypothetical protein